MTTPHKHAELIKKWADDTSQPAWYWDESEGWIACPYGPAWLKDVKYAIGEKPTYPPAKMCVLAGVEFPMPMTEPPAVRSDYFVAEAAEISSMNWDGGSYDMFLLNAGVVHLSKEGAIAHTRALIAATKQAMEAAK